jgi:hypothetical protein
LHRFSDGLFGVCLRTRAQIEPEPPPGITHRGKVEKEVIIDGVIICCRAEGEDV